MTCMQNRSMLALHLGWVSHVTRAASYHIIVALVFLLFSLKRRNTKFCRAPGWVSVSMSNAQSLKRRRCVIVQGRTAAGRQASSHCCSRVHGVEGHVSRVKRTTWLEQTLFVLLLCIVTLSVVLQDCNLSSAVTP